MSRRLAAIGLLIVLAGFGLIIAGSALQGAGSAGGVVFVGPFPFVFGSGPAGAQLGLISLVVGGVMVALMLLWGRRLFRQKGD